mgnify:CR=1 FL=1
MVMDATIAELPDNTRRNAATSRQRPPLRRLLIYPLISFVALGAGIGLSEWTIDKAVKAARRAFATSLVFGPPKGLEL